ncbi:hypothetical protein NFC80_20475 [Bacillus halotolerans]|uniref:hypothetical protein n=1 Tax=Bacillus halotolerans TaxID=260554 RepID=UPI002155DCCE|nr:hypothetical protein [Bacillus halotolerans]MCR6598913.1 hypothetical protein [Bacillus halotolerans]
MLAFIHHPKILFLDEPTIGLDILRKEEYTEISSSYLLTSHQIDDVERLCKRIILIDEGEIKFDGPKEKLSQLTNSKREA